MFEYLPMHVAPWGVEIVIYFFLIGTASMVFAVAAGHATFGHVAEPLKNFEVTGAIIALVLLAAVVPLLILDISQPWRFLNPILYFRWTSPLSWGSLFLPLFGLAILGFLYGIYTKHPLIQRYSAILGTLLALSMPLYTGLDLMVNHARELWANPTIPMLFVVLSITSGAGLVALVQLVLGRLTQPMTRQIRFMLAFSTGVTFWLFLGLVMTMVYGTEEVQGAFAAINNDFALEFYGIAFVIGTLVPMVIVFGPMLHKVMDFGRKPIAVTIAGLCGALGAYVLRDVLIHAGQLAQLYY
ncbi:MAG: NrfD/PsrC family molybdoenzyme membrane anchor subunit [Phaeovulum sp.]|uniref:NrfD/PsrC family molybdoenzyme membrane anchor subunit n=1 Tax=Phaeovulum sp. TaxID=2934796 RepID=UPI002731F5CE|nr:NrfD/PsrC family molybdoenzyme membrane anchor subunit [Phaeovulum sp.]MDP2063877.1 NrfD/PsrC family molybdoenzyme membrane anchor subunit [Phaeovulum sp.]MDP3861676.1 NrfD/PsrC family molybdoenzyme membrane anchor subunit [Phaeovulum sp.]